MFFPPKDVVAAENLEEWNDSKENIFRRNFPLHHTCRDGDVVKLAVLLDHVSNASPYRTEFGSVISLNLSSEDPFYGWMPAHWAAYFGKPECLLMVVQSSKHVDVPSLKLLQTPTHMAAYAGNSFCLQWLLDHGADPLRWDYMKETPLHKAARTGALPAISLLISRGAKLHWKNIHGQTAADVAASTGCNDAALYLNHQAQLISNVVNKPMDCVKNGNFVNLVSTSNGYYGFHQTVPHDDFQDVLLCPVVTQNARCIGGRKRTQETYDCGTSVKRARFLKEPRTEDIDHADVEMTMEHSQNGCKVLPTRCMLPRYL